MNSLLLSLCAIAASANDDVTRERIDPQGVAGSLVICGGDALPDAVMDRFVELAGGEEARLVVIPTASERADKASEESLLASWKDRTLASVTLLHTRSREEADKPEFVAPLKTATAVWFGGGVQSRLAEAYVGTAVARELQALLRRGGVIGGTSAGASIQAEYMVRGNPLGNREIMAEGYERGFAFLPGCAVDQHFSSRRRFADMTKLVDAYPQVLGIGIDENTALVVSGKVAEVVGANNVYFYDRTKPVVEGKPDYATVRPGERFDMVRQR